MGAGVGWGTGAGTGRRGVDGGMGAGAGMGGGASGRVDEDVGSGVDTSEGVVERPGAGEPTTNEGGAGLVDGVGAGTSGGVGGAGTGQAASRGAGAGTATSAGAGDADCEGAGTSAGGDRAASVCAYIPRSNRRFEYQGYHRLHRRRPFRACTCSTTLLRIYLVDPGHDTHHPPST